MANPKRIPPRDGMWLGQTATLVGGGPSLKNFSWEVLRDVPNIIVVNRAYRDCPWADYLFSEDIRFFEKFAVEDPEGWAAFEGLKIFHCLDESYAPTVKDVAPDVHMIHKKRVDKYWSKSLADGLSYSSNSMIGALNLAAILGVTRINLLGVDCVPTLSRKEKIENYHTGEKLSYPPDWRADGHQLDSFASDFTYWAAPNLKMVGVEVVNLNPDSGVTCWKKQDWREVLPVYPAS